MSVEPGTDNFGLCATDTSPSLYDPKNNRSMCV